jgi:hypothetical protein
MTDVPDGPADGEPERGTRRPSRAGDSGSPVGSTLSIVLAVIAVIAGFLILRAITDDDDGDAGGLGATTDDAGSLAGAGSVPTSAGGSADTTPTTTGPVRTGAMVVVANASGVSGSAAAMTQALQGAGYTTGTAGNSTGEQLTASVVYYVAGDAAAQAVASSVATDLGGVATAEMPATPPIDAGLGGGTVLVMVGTDTAGKTLNDLNPAGAVPAPAPAGGETTTTAAG